MAEDAMKVGDDDDGDDDNDDDGDGDDDDAVDIIMKEITTL